MSVEARDQHEFERYLDWQRTQRPHRIETLGGAVTSLALATFDLGIIEVRDPRPTPRSHSSPEVSGEVAEAVPLRPARQRRLAEFATESAELGYAKTA